MVGLALTLSRLRPVRVLLLGDLMLDAYTIGNVRRISPEAPVSVLQVTCEEERPGGAGNVALNLSALGAHVTLVGRVGADRAADVLSLNFEKMGINFRPIVHSGYQTPLKNRLIAANQQMLRVDFEHYQTLPGTLEQMIIDELDDLLVNVDIVAISDYGKGFLTHKLLSEVIKRSDKTVIVDPKGTDFQKYQGATIIKPNLLEARAAAPGENLEQIASTLLKQTKSEALFVTRGEEGISIFTKKEPPCHVPSCSVRQIKDVTGAGDTALAMLTVAVGSGLSLPQAAALANIAAGIAVEQFGCAQVPLSAVARRLLQQDIGNKVFDEDHLFALHLATKEKPPTVVSLDTTLTFDAILFSSLRKIALEKTGDLILYVQDCDEEALLFLASLHEIDFIVLKKGSLENLCELLRPAKVINLNFVSTI